MKTGDIVFFKGNSFISRIISKLTKSEYTHVAMAINGKDILEADRFIRVRIRPIKDHEVYTIMRYTDLTETERSTLFAGGLSYVGAKYDYLSIVLWFFKLLFRSNRNTLVDNANSVYCSEMIDRLYKYAGIDLVPDRGDGDVLPIHLLNSPLLTQVYHTEGKE